MSMRSLDIVFSLSLSAARSGLPGAYDFTGSFTGAGTRLLPLKPAIARGDGALEGANAASSSLFSGAGCDLGRIVAVIFVVLSG
jgi:hypothetical protein